jgi:hypothetical protein
MKNQIIITPNPDVHVWSAPTASCFNLGEIPCRTQLTVPTSPVFRILYRKEKSPAVDGIPNLQPLKSRLNYYKPLRIIIRFNEYGYWIKQAKIKSKFWC